MNYNDEYFDGCGYKKCMYPKCNKITKNGARGLCMNHYVGYNRRVKEGKFTWEQLEKEGKCKIKMTQAEKNANQSHPHIRYKKKTNVNLDF